MGYISKNKHVDSLKDKEIQEMITKWESEDHSTTKGLRIPLNFTLLDGIELSEEDLRNNLSFSEPPKKKLKVKKTIPTIIDISSRKKNKNSLF